MKKKTTALLATSALAMLTLTGCSVPGGTTVSPDDVEIPPITITIPELGVGDSALGEVIVDGVGLTVYVFDKDVANSGTSACTGECAATWPAITVTEENPAVDGVTGVIGTIPGADGGFQVTVNGLPLYGYAYDAGPGETNGQGFNGVWWAVSPNGEKITG